MRRVEFGVLIQERDTTVGEEWEVVSERQPTDIETAELEFAWTVAMHTKSNAIVVVKDRAAVGVGAGDQSRVGAAERAVARAGERSEGAVAASDAFFPFRDGLDALARSGVTAVVEPGGLERPGPGRCGQRAWDRPRVCRAKALRALMSALVLDGRNLPEGEVRGVGRRRRPRLPARAGNGPGRRRSASHTYVRGKRSDAAEVGIQSFHHELRADIGQDELEDVIAGLTRTTRRRDPR